jgi:D-lactate dehydrogenase
MKITIIETQSEEETFLKNALNNHELYITPELKAEDIEKIKDNEIMLASVWTKIDAELLKRLPGLKYVVTLSTGYDHINLDDCKQFGIQVSNIPSYGERTVAEFTIGLMFAISRNIHIAHRRSSENNFFVDDLEGSDVFGKTLGIIGLGKAGKETALLAKAIGMKIIAFDVFKDENFASKNNLDYVEIEKLYATADYITIFAPHNETTHHLLNKQAFSKMKTGVRIINTARGAIINTPDLIDALKNQIVKGVALDVFEDEKNLIDDNVESDAHKWHSELMKLNALHTCHIASFSIEAQDRARQIILDNIDGYIKGRTINILQ